MTRTARKIQAIDLFCGVGGLTAGLRSAGIKVRAGVDIDPQARYPYEANNDTHFIQADVASLSGAEVQRLFGRARMRLLAGCAPCQPFSALRRRQVDEQGAWAMLHEFARLVRLVRPELVTMENVVRVIHHRPYEDFVDTLAAAGYWIDAGTVRCVEVGVPQDRRRHVLVASRLGPISLAIRKRKTRSVRDAIGDLPELASGQTDPGDPLHCARALTEVNIRRLAASTAGGTWADWPAELRAPCHRSEKGASFQSVYARMSWDAPAPTITTQCYNFGAGRFGHPDQLRAITLREAALLQSFPKDYIFAEPQAAVSFNSVGRLIGNAVPPLLGEAIGQIFVEHVAANG